MSTLLRSEIEWRSDISSAPKNRRILIIGTPMIPIYVSG